MNNNPNNLKVGDLISVEEAWEDEAGHYHDETAKILSIDDNGELSLEWLASNEIREWLAGCDGYFAKDFKAD